jgi:hypothetical protein
MHSEPGALNPQSAYRASKINNLLQQGQARNQIRGLLSEHGIVIARAIAQLRRGLASIVGNDNDGLSEMVRSLMRELQTELAELDRRIGTL